MYEPLAAAVVPDYAVPGLQNVLPQPEKQTTNRTKTPRHNDEHRMVS